MAYYNIFSCSISVDDGEVLSNCGTYNIPALSSDGENDTLTYVTCFENKMSLNNQLPLTKW